MSYARQIAAIWFCLVAANFHPSGSRAAQEGSEQLPMNPSAQSADRELNLKAQGFVDRANSAYRARNFTEAVANYSELIKLKPKDPRAYYNRGLAYNKLDDLEHALADFSQAISLDPTFYLALMNRGNIYSKRGLYSEAIADYDLAIPLKPDDFLIAYNRGVACRALGRLDEALRDFNKAIELNRKDAQSYAERGLLFLEKEQHDAARADLQIARGLDPENARAAAGLQILRDKILQLDPNTSNILGLAQRLQGLRDLYELAEVACFANGEEPDKLREVATEKGWTAQGADRLADASSGQTSVINGWVATTNFGEIAVIQSRFKSAPAAFTCSITAKVNKIGSLEELQSEFTKHFKTAAIATEFEHSSNVARYWLPHNPKCDAMTAIVIGPEQSLITIRILHGRLRGEAM